jgi:hypothetical protein
MQEKEREGRERESEREAEGNIFSGKCAHLQRAFYHMIFLASAAVISEYKLSIFQGVIGLPFDIFDFCSCYIGI